MTPRSRRVLPAAAAVAAALLSLAPLAAGARSGHPPPGGKARKLLVGALLSLTGGWSTLGQASEAALEIARRDFNRESAAIGARVRVRVLVEDTQLLPERALARLKRLYARGVRVVVGPQSSAEVAAVRDYAQKRGILLISQGSTASSLSIENDNVVRLCPNDRLEAQAIHALLQADGMSALVPISRDDPGNLGLRDSTAALFAAGGGAVSEGVEYSAGTTDFGPVAAALAAQVAAAQESVGAERVAIHLCAFDEVVELFRSARSHPELLRSRWYGTDGVVFSRALVGDAEAAAFAESAGYPSPTFGLDDAARPIWEPLSAEIEERVGFAPDAFALAAYDALWIAALARIDAGAKATIAQRRRAVLQAANRFWGATGWTGLDAAGDRAVGNYDFWAVREQDGEPAWVRVARYVNGALSR